MPTSTETTPLVPPAPITSSSKKSGARRSVTFNPKVSTHGSGTTSPLSKAISKDNLPPNPQNEAAAGPLSALNSKLRRRHSAGAPQLPAVIPVPKAGAQRTTRAVQKLKLLPNPDYGDDGPDEESGREVYSQFTRIKDPTARRDAARLGKADREKLPRVTAYCTANAYRLDDLMRFLRGRGKSRGAQPKQFDECIYTPFSYRPTLEDTLDTTANPQRRERRFSDSAVEVDKAGEMRRDDLIDLSTEAGDTSLDNGLDHVPSHTASEMQQPHIPSQDNLDFDTQVHTPEVFLFNYGTVVIWGMTVKEEERFLKDIAKFETEKLSADDIQTEAFNFYYTREYQARIYNDFISLRDKRNYMTKLAISHALSQSVKVCSTFECIA